MYIVEGSEEGGVDRWGQCGSALNMVATLVGTYNVVVAGRQLIKKTGTCGDLACGDVIIVVAPSFSRA